MWIRTVSRSTSTTQKSNTKPYTAELLISSAVFGASSTEGLQNTVSHNAVGSGAGRLPGDQWIAAATLAKLSEFSGFEAANTRPPVKHRSPVGPFCWAAATRPSSALSLIFGLLA